MTMIVTTLSLAVLSFVALRIAGASRAEKPQPVRIRDDRR